MRAWRAALGGVPGSGAEQKGGRARWEGKRRGKKKEKKKRKRKEGEREGKEVRGREIRAENTALGRPRTAPDTCERDALVKEE